MNNEQFAEMQRKNVDAAMKLTHVSLENTRRLMEIQAETARTLFDESVKNARALAETQDPEAALALRTQFAQESSQKMMEAMRRMAELTAEAQAEFNGLFSQQVANASQEMTENLRKMMTASGLPVGSEDPFASLQKAFGAARDAFDQITKASAAAFTPPAKEKEKSGKAK